MKNSRRVTVAAPAISAELLESLRIRESSPLPKLRQLYLNLYGVIEGGQMPFDSRLPSSRDLAAQLDLGRNTVIGVYEQLTSEGMLKTDGRRGTRVARRLGSRRDESGLPWPHSDRAAGNRVVSSTGSALSPGEPDTRLFPHAVWRKAQSRAVDRVAGKLGYRNSGLPETREAIARYLANYRSLSVDAEQIVITSGTRQSLALAAHLYADPGDSAWVECPGYLGAVDAFRQSGLSVTPCRVDAEGLVMPPTDTMLPRLIYVTPCFQYPTGVPLATGRRAALLQLSREQGCIVFEDDYDSEFRDDTQPRPALAADAAGARVLHAGTFSKLLFPAMRVGWLVLPQHAVEQAERCLRVIGGGCNTIAQAVVTELLDNGSIGRHLRQARHIYGQRRQALISALQDCDLFEPIDEVSGSLSLVLQLKDSVSLTALQAAFTEAGIGAQPLEHLDWQLARPTRCKAIVIGLGNVDTLAIPATSQCLVKALASVSRAAH
ncbi:MocR-like pyridoxine biosynthesis transcription factor PdxR [Granulosicoccus sp. 3-233]|uniref:MocR-like pyridoxine biosynthesis transcription factor PdxR n=1 Tax=Granulosicoccus sp. 3-233 TaxID=3417969 RepID=UPI003D348BE8